MKRSAPVWLIIVLAAAGCQRPSPETSAAAEPEPYQELVQLFTEWRGFQKPRLSGGVPDYTKAAMQAQHEELATFQARLQDLQPLTWSIHQQVDYHIVRAEMNGLDFDHRVLRPWSRNPAFYTVVHPSPTDVPAREGTERYGAINLYEYRFPLSEEARADLRAKLQVVPRLLEQAKGNLAGDARDLWMIGIKAKKSESEVLASLAKRLCVEQPDLVADVERAKAAVDDFRAWLELRCPPTGSAAGIGTEHFDWYMKHVHLVPYTWQDQLAILERELARARAHLALEEVRNADLPPLEPAASLEVLQERLDRAVTDFYAFLDRKQIFTVPDYMRTALNRKVSGFVSPDGPRDFFTQVDYRDSMPMRCHGTHWFDLARMVEEPHASPIRRVPLLYNIWDSRAEGLATGFEEMMLQAGLFDSRPRARELVYILLANRAARAMGDLRMHSGEFTLEQAVKYAVEHTPRGWLLAEGRTAWFDEELYLQQPGYGTSYVVGKSQIDRLLSDYRQAKGASFTMREFMDRFHAAGMIPLSLIRWELTGQDDEMLRLSR